MTNTTAHTLPIVGLAFCLAVSSCTGGSGGGGNVTLTGNEQPADPVVVEVPIAYVKRPIPEQPFDLRRPISFHPGAELYVQSNTTSSQTLLVNQQIRAIVSAELDHPADEIAIDIKDLETSFDGKTLIFSARAVPEPVANNVDDHSWNLWLYDFQTQQASYLFPSRLTRNEGIEYGGSHDIAGHFLANDRVVFSSTRQTSGQAKQLNEGRGQLYAALDENRREPAAVLHVYDPNADESIRQISFNQSHDLDPTVLSNGKIVFSRWDRAPGNNHISLYSINPNGRDLSLLYGYHSEQSGSPGSEVRYTQTREMEDGRLLSLIKRFDSDTLGGALTVIDSNNFVEFDQATWANQPTDSNSQGQQAVSQQQVRTDSERSVGGQYAAAYPLNDNSGRILVSWSPCRVVAQDNQLVPCNIGPANALPAPPLYGIWLLDPNQQSQAPVVRAQEGFMIAEIVAGEPRSFPALPDSISDANDDLANKQQGQLLIDSVYDFDGNSQPANASINSREPGTQGYIDRPARFVRFIQPVPIPDRDLLTIPNYAFGPGGQSMREILGYAVVEPDGSVTANVPAQTPFMLSVLDDKGRRIGGRHNHWLQLAPGEVLHCTGCHTRNSRLPHGRLDSQPPSSNPGAVSLSGGVIGFIGTKGDLFGSRIGQTMAEVYGLRQPAGNLDQAVRDLDIHIIYDDEWTDTPALTADASIDFSYDPAWTAADDIPADKAIIVDNLDPTLPSRIVINYVDHIQAIWNRTRAAVAWTPPGGMLGSYDSCVSCHTTNGNTATAPGQLDLGDQLEGNTNQYRSYRELLFSDNEQWLDENNVFTDRSRTCTTLDTEGNPVQSTRFIRIRANMSSAGANNSNAFFNCFEGGDCGRNNDANRNLPAECVEEAGTPAPPTSNTVDHQGMLSDSELRLISEWLDIGAQYYNNPFDTRLTP